MYKFSPVIFSKCIILVTYIGSLTHANFTQFKCRINFIRYNFQAEKQQSTHHSANPHYPKGVVLRPSRKGNK